MNNFESFLNELELEHKEYASLFEAIKEGYDIYHPNGKNPLNEGLISGFLNLFKKKTNPTEKLIQAIDQEFLKTIKLYINGVGKSFDTTFKAYDKCNCDGVFATGLSTSVNDLNKGIFETDAAIVNFQNQLLQLEENIFKLITKLGKEYDRIDAKEQHSIEQVKQAKEIREQAKKERRK